jgi:hypothetical protein
MLLKDIFTKICSTNYENDGVLFDIQRITTSEIKKEGDYKGIRIKIGASLDTLKTNLQIDIGFGDIVIPEPLIIDYPVILDLEHPTVLAYSTASVIAEKFHAMIALSEFNSRMKDFYDVYQLIEKQIIDTGELFNAVKATFEKREIQFNENHNLFKSEFITDKSRNIQWKSFLKKTGINNSLEFETVIKGILEVLKPIYEKLKLFF